MVPLGWNDLAGGAAGANNSAAPISGATNGADANKSAGAIGDWPSDRRRV